jgi:hypothetical protein
MRSRKNQGPRALWLWDDRKEKKRCGQSCHANRFSEWETQFQFGEQGAALQLVLPLFVRAGPV